MMAENLDLPKPIAIYIAAENSGNVEMLNDCLADDALVRDEGLTIKGLAAIKEWKAETKRKYQHSIEPLDVTPKGDRVVVRNRLTGNFPGSPIELEFVFTLRDEKIISLEILS